MIALALMLCGLDASQADVRSRATLAPIVATDAVLIGQSLRLTVTLEGPAARGATLDGDFSLGPHWSVIDGPRPGVDPGLSEARRPEVQLEWTVMALESGTVATPPFVFQLEDETDIAVAPATIDVEPALLEGEDAPRPLVGFRDVEDRAVGNPRLALAALLALFVLPFAGLGIRRMRRRGGGSTQPPGPTAREQMDTLDPSGTPAAAMAALGPLVRRAVDDARGVGQAALTDAEWAAEIDAAADLGEDARGGLAQLVRELSVVRFGGAEPTSFAAKEAIARASAMVDELAHGRSASDGQEARP